MNPLSSGERHRLLLRRNGNYEDAALISGADSRKDGRGFALFDYDRDGWLDLAVISPNRPKLQIFKNRLQPLGAGNRFIELELVGGHEQAESTSEWSAADAFGAEIEVHTGDEVRRFVHACGEGIASQNSHRIHIGLGDTPQADAITIRWPSGRTTRLTEIAAGSRLTVSERQSTVHP